MRRLRTYGPLMAALLPAMILGFTADAGDAGGGSGPAAGEGGKPDEGKPDEGKPSEGKPDEGKPPERTLTQKQFNDAVAAEKRRWDAAHAQDQADAKSWREAQEAQASEIEKASKKAAADATAETSARYEGMLIAAEVRALAAAAKFRNPIAALALLKEKGALTGIKVNEDGTVDSAAIQTALTGLAEEEPYMIDTGTTPPTPPAAAGAGGASSKGPERKDLRPGMDRLRHAYAQNPITPKGTRNTT